MPNPAACRTFILLSAFWLLSTGVTALEMAAGVIPDKYLGKLLGYQLDYDRPRNCSIILVDPETGTVDWLDPFHEGIWASESVLDLKKGLFWFIGNYAEGPGAISFNLTSGYIQSQIRIAADPVLNVEYDNDRSVALFVTVTEKAVAVSRLELESGSVNQLVELPEFDACYYEASAYDPMEQLYFAVFGSAGSGDAYLVSVNVGPQPHVVGSVRMDKVLVPMFFEPTSRRVMAVSGVPYVIDPKTGNATAVAGARDLGGSPNIHGIAAYDSVLYAAVNDFGVQKIVRENLCNGTLLNSDVVVVRPTFLHYIPPQ